MALPTLPRLNQIDVAGPRRNATAFDFGGIFGGGDPFGGGFIGTGGSTGNPTRDCGLFGLGCVNVGYGSDPFGGIFGGGTSGSGSTSIRGTSSSTGMLGGLLPAINWGRIGAFLLGLLLFGGGLYLIKPINQSVGLVVKTAGKKLAETSAGAA